MLWKELKASELTALASRNAIVVVPVASVENHGPHLATGVDTILTGEIAQRAARKTKDVPVVVTPTVWCGLAEMHMSLGGTITLDLETYYALLRCICRSVARQNFRRILILNGHGGNAHALNAIVNGIGAELDIAIANTTYWHLVADEIRTILEDQATLEHACEAETSMMMAIVPHLADQSLFGQAIGPTSRTHTEVAGPAVHRWRSFAARTDHGAIGNPTRASAEKGERLLEAAAQGVATLLSNEEFWSMTV